jgi:uncharacterized protein
MNRIIIKTDKVKMEAELNESKTAAAILHALPLATEISTWGDEIYFEIPVKVSLENGTDEVQVGDLGYWPQGHCFCIFFGLTPISSEGNIKPASAVTIVGKLLGMPEKWKAVAAGEWITIEKIGV